MFLRSSSASTSEDSPLKGEVGSEGNDDDSSHGYACGTGQRAHTRTLGQVMRGRGVGTAMLGRTLLLLLRASHHILVRSHFGSVLG